MDKMIGILQLLFAGVFGAMAIGTLINMLFIFTRPETISVVNAMVGQTLMVICLLAIARILFRKGSLQVRPPE